MNANLDFLGTEQILNRLREHPLTEDVDVSYRTVQRTLKEDLAQVPKISGRWALPAERIDEAARAVVERLERGNLSQETADE